MTFGLLPFHHDATVHGGVKSQDFPTENNTLQASWGGELHGGRE